MEPNQQYDLVIIGAGPAGMTAGIYAARAGLSVVMLEKGAPGGQMLNTAEIDNYTGFETILGPDLSMKMFEHTQKHGVAYAYGNVTKVTDHGTYKLVYTDSNEIYQTKAVIIASGAKNKRLGVPGEDELAGRGISWCAVCDGAFFRNQDVVVVGGGNSAVEEALYLANIVNKVTIIHRRQQFRADQAAVNRAKAHPKIVFELDAVVEQFNEENGKLKSVTVKNVVTGETKELIAQGAFIYIGLLPVSDFVKGLVDMDEYGYIIVNEKMETSVPGIFAAGDVIQKELRQIVTATNDGAIAAQSAYKYIEALGK